MPACPTGALPATTRPPAGTDSRLSPACTIQQFHFWDARKGAKAKRCTTERLGAHLLSGHGQGRLDQIRLSNVSLASAGFLSFPVCSHFK